MARDFSGSNQKIVFGDQSAILNEKSVLSGSIWVYQDNITQNHLVYDNRGGSGEGILFFFDDAGFDSGRTDVFKILVESVSGVESASIETATSSGKQNVWQHLYWSFTAGSGTGLQIWIDGVEDANSPATTADDPDTGAGGQNLHLAERSDGALDRNGRLAEIAFWNRVLTDDEIIALSKGFSPLFMSNGLDFYSSLIGTNSPETELIVGASGTVTGATKIEHLRMIYPRNFR